MTSAEQGEQPVGLAERLVDYGRETMAIAEVEFCKLRRDPTELFTRSVQPVLWLVVFGQVFGRLLLGRRILCS